MFNIALLGAGRIGQVHAANIASHGATTLWSVVDPNQEFATRLATQYQARQQSLDEAMTDPNVHAVLIASATDTHADLIEMAARHGKAIFCEKPVHLDLARVRDCLKVVKEYDVPLFIGFNRRFDPQFRRVKTDAQAGRIGKPESLLIISRDPSPPPAEYVRVSGGMFRDMTIHDFDMARFIMGEEPVSVYAQGSNLVDPAIGEAGDIDTAFIVLKYASGAMATIVNSRRSSYGYDQRLELHGSEGLLCAGNILETRCSTTANRAAPARCRNTSSCSATNPLTPRNGNTLLRSCAAKRCLTAAAMMVNVRCTSRIKRWSHCAASARSSSKHNHPTQRDIIMKKLIVAALIAMTSGAALAENEQIVFSTPNLAMPFEVHMQRTAVKAAKEMGVKLQVLDGQGSSPKQVADLENAITRGAQGFIVSPNDVNAVSSAVDEIQDAKLPVVTLDRSVDSQKKVPHFGANNYKGGQAIGDFVKTKFPDGAEIILLTGQPGSSSNIERTKGIRDSLKAGGDKYKIVADQTGNWMRSEGMRIVESVLPSLPKRPQVILSANDDMALGAIEALQSQGVKPGEILVTGFDAVPEALARVRDGWLAVTADQRPGFAVQTAMSQLVANVREKKAITGADYPPTLITKENLQQAERIGEAGN